MIRFLAVMAVIAAAASPAAAQPRLEPLWTLEGLSSPESVIATGAGDLYVSNIGGEGDARDGDGFIARVSTSGAIIERAWASGLDAPKGMGLKDGVLYVSDIDDLVAIDAATGRTLARRAVPDAVFLNDVAVTPGGVVLVSDSGTARILALIGDEVVPWAADERLRAINGLYPETDRLVISTMQGRLLAMDYETKAITDLADGLGDADGLAPLGGGEWLVSEWPGRLFHVGADGSNTVVLDTREAGTYLNDLLLTGDTLLIPNLRPGTLTAYRVVR